MIEDFFRYAAKNILHRKVRSWLTLLGIFIGIAAVVALVSLGQGLTKYINEEAQKLGTDKLIIMPKGQFGAPGTSAAVQLTEKDVDVIKKVSGVAETMGIVIQNAPIQFANSQIFNNVFGIAHDSDYKLFQEIMAVTQGIEKGRDLKKDDAFKVVLGNDYFTTTVFDKKVGLGDTIKINNYDFEVVGEWERIGNPDDDRNIIINKDVFRQIFNNSGNRVDIIYLKVADASQINEMEDRISKQLRYLRGLKKGEEDFTVQSPQQLLDTFNQVFALVQAVIIGIAAISLVVGGIGIMNTMYTAVLERTREIGVMKSIGARNSDIMSLFMIESGILGFVGGAIGIIVGMGIAKLTEYIATVYLGSALLKAYFPWYLIVGSLAFAFIIGVVSGTLPALQASKLKPVDALRYE